MTKDYDQTSAEREPSGRYIVGGDGIPYGPFPQQHVTATQSDERAAVVEMTGPVVSVEQVDLPSPDAHAVAAHTQGEPLDVILRRILRRREVAAIGHEEAIANILAAVARDAEASPGAYTDRLTLHADDLDVPVDGPRWQVLDAKDEQTWHDLDAVAECELGVQCPIAASLPSDVECIVLVGTAWGEGFAHIPADAMVDVRIPASVDGGCE